MKKNYLFMYNFTTLTGDSIKTGFIKAMGSNLENATYNARVQVLKANSNLFVYNLKLDMIKLLGIYIGRW